MVSLPAGAFEAGAASTLPANASVAATARVVNWVLKDMVFPFRDEWAQVRRDFLGMG
jgi:hypothetical protein